MSAWLLSTARNNSISPDVFSMSTAISACEGAGRWLLATNLLGIIQFHLLQSHLLSYNAAISACGSCSQWSMGVSLSAKAACNQLSPDIISYNAMCDDMGCSWLRTMHHLMRAAAQSGLRLTSVSYTIALNAGLISYNLVVSIFHYPYSAPTYALSYIIPIIVASIFSSTISIHVTPNPKP